MALVLREQLLGSSAPMVELRERVQGRGGRGVAACSSKASAAPGASASRACLHEIGPRKHHDFVRVDPDEDDEPPRVDDQLVRANGGTLLVKEIAHVGRGPQRRLLRAIKRGPRTRARQGRHRRVLRRARDRGDRCRSVARGRRRAVRSPSSTSGSARCASRCRRCAAVRKTCRCCSSTSGAPRRARSAATSSASTPRAIDKLTAYSWPGNVAELRDVVRRLCLRRRRGHVELGDVEAVLPPVEERVPVEQLSFEEMVRAKIRALLQRMEGYPDRGSLRRGHLARRAPADRAGARAHRQQPAQGCRDPRAQPQHPAQEDRRAQGGGQRAAPVAKKVTAGAGAKPAHMLK